MLESQKINCCCFWYTRMQFLLVKVLKDKWFVKNSGINNTPLKPFPFPFFASNLKVSAFVSPIRNEDFIMSMTLQHKQENMLFKRKWQKSVYKEGCDGLVFFFWQKLLIRLDSASNLVFCKFWKNQSTTLIINEQKAETKQFPLKGAFLFNRNFCKSNNSF